MKPLTINYTFQSLSKDMKQWRNLWQSQDFLTLAECVMDADMPAEIASRLRWRVHEFPTSYTITLMAFVPLDWTVAQLEQFGELLSEIIKRNEEMHGT